jgi:hypothetical protein
MAIGIDDEHCCRFDSYRKLCCDQRNFKTTLTRDTWKTRRGKVLGGDSVTEDTLPKVCNLSLNAPVVVMKLLPFAHFDKMQELKQAVPVNLEETD